MAASVVTVVVEDFLQSLQQGMKLGQQWGVEHELREIRDLLSSVLGVLPEAENKYRHSLERQKWVRDLKLAAFDAEDLLEELSVEEGLWQRKWKVRRLFRAVDRLTFGRRMRGELRDVTRQLQELVGSDRVGLVRNILAEILNTNEAARAVPFIGRDDEKGELRRRLLDMGREQERDLPVLTVYGSRGIGKTALVQEVCSEWGVSWHFDVIIWVNASLPFDENRMARYIIASLTNGVGPEEENVVEEHLLVLVSRFLDWRKKYLFILDDLSVHDSERRRWLRFFSFLEGGASGSKILVTTRDSGGMTSEDSNLVWISSRDNILFLRDLTREESLDLLLKTASEGGGEEIIDPEKLQIAEEVAARCDGNPLFVLAVGYYLSFQHDANDWSRLRGKLRARPYYEMLTMLICGGYPYGHLSPMVKRYNHLPPRIKQCFGICSLFPRGHTIDRQTLAELWIALGYIKPSYEDHRPLEDIADDYFNQLLRRELFRVKKFDIFGKVRSVVLHPVAGDLASSVAGWEGKGQLRWNKFFLGEGEQNARHISVTDYHISFLPHFMFSGMRTVLHFVEDNHKNGVRHNYLISHLDRARVLDLHHMNMEAVPEAVWLQKHLRYLDLSDNRRIEALPPTITGLLNLQTLKLSGCSALKELPQDMRKMVALRHIYIDGCRKLSLMPKGLGDLKFLNILTDFILPPADSSSVDSASLADLCKLNDLRGSLRITNLSYSQYERKAATDRFEIDMLLDKKSSLASVELRFMNLRTDTSLLEKLRPHPNLKGLRIHNYGGTKFSKWMTQPLTHLPDLVEIALIKCENCKYLPQFGWLRHLKSLTIQGLPDLVHMESGSGESSPDNAQPFGELSSLCIRDCPKLERLPMIPHLAKLTLVNVSEQLFGHPFCVASLKTLRLENIELLHHLPKEWLRDPTSLEELHIGSCPKLNFLSMQIPCLVKLTLANVSEELFRHPCRLPSLKTLRLENIELLDYLSEDWLKDLASLKELHIRSCPSLVSLSRGMMHLENLVSLSIWNCKELNLSEDEQGNVLMDLQGPKRLKFLTIYKASKMEYLPEWLSHAYSLRFLCIRSCPNLVELPEWIGNHQLLELLELVHCPRLTSLPAGMYDFTDDYPRKLNIVDCPRLRPEGIRHSCRL